MALPAGYSYDNDGNIFSSDGTGPYSMAPGGVMTFIGGSLVAVNTGGFSQGPSGKWYFTDASGPYTKGPGGMYSS